MFVQQIPAVMIGVGIPQSRRCRSSSTNPPQPPSPTKQSERKSPRGTKKYEGRGRIAQLCTGKTARNARNVRVRTDDRCDSASGCLSWPCQRSLVTCGKLLTRPPSWRSGSVGRSVIRGAAGDRGCVPGWREAHSVRARRVSLRIVARSADDPPKRPTTLRGSS